MEYAKVDRIGTLIELSENYSKIEDVPDEVKNAILTLYKYEGVKTIIPPENPLCGDYIVGMDTGRVLVLRLAINSDIGEFEAEGEE